MLFGLMLCSTPIILAASIVVSTFVLEDAAIVYAGLLATGGMIAPPIAFLALFVGIYAGDIGLYFLGSAAHCSKRVRHFLGERRIVKAEQWLRQRAAAALIGARFLPGSRLPLYAASGFLHVPFTLFALVTGAASFAWSAVVFSLVYRYGADVVEALGQAKYVVAVLALIAVAFGPGLIARATGKRLFVDAADV